MPIFPTEAENEIPKEPIAKPEQDTAAVYQTPEKPITTSATMEGTPTTVDYYYGILGDDDYPTRLDLGLHASLQQYIKVKNMIILNTSEISGSKDENQIWEVRGEANVYPGIPVNQWDMFTMRLQDGRLGLFTVYANPEETTFLSYSGYRIQYELVSIMNEVYRAELIKKTQNTLYFNPENPTCPGANINEVQEDVSAFDLMAQVLTLLYDEYFDKELDTFVLYDEYQKRWYDCAAVQFFTDITPLKVRAQRPRPKVYDVPSIEHTEQIRTLWDVLLYDKLDLLNVVTERSVDVSLSAYHSNYIMSGISLLNIAGVIHPADGSSLIGEVDGSNSEFYVLTESFYLDDENNMTPWEKFIRNALSQEQYLVSSVEKELEGLNELTTKQRFHKLLLMIYLLVKKL